MSMYVCVCVCNCVYVSMYACVCVCGGMSARNSQASIAICYSKLSWLLLKIKFG